MDRTYVGGRIPIMQVLVIGLILSSHLQQISASYKSCYYACFVPCVIVIMPKVCKRACADACDKDRSHQIASSTEDYCSIGCYIEQCAKYGRDVGKVKECVKNCDENTCSTKKLPVN